MTAEGKQHRNILIRVNMVPLMWWCLAVASLLAMDTCAQVKVRSGKDRPRLTPEPPRDNGAAQHADIPDGEKAAEDRPKKTLPPLKKLRAAKLAKKHVEEKSVEDRPIITPSPPSDEGVGRHPNILVEDKSVEDRPIITPSPPSDEGAGRHPNILVEEKSVEDRPIITPSPPSDEGAGRHPNILDKGFEYTNPDFVDGKALYQKDMLLTPEQWQALRERKALAALTTRWPAGTDGFPLVPYITVGTVNVAAVQAGLQHWMSNSCVKFALTTNTNQPHLRFINGSGCYSFVGRQTTNGQDVSIGVGCTEVGTVAHEVGHALGFIHEQSRPDRDSYVTIVTANIISGKAYNFDKYAAASINNYSVPYDYSSVMHYGSTYFTSNGRLTISTLDPLTQGLIGQRTGLSHRDKRLGNIMYGCIGKWLTACKVAADPCKNGGYFGASCACVCPPGTSGTQCQNVTGGYYDALKQPCSKTITTAGVITSPNYPNNYPAGSRCTYVIQAPRCYYAKLTFSSFKLYGRNPFCNNALCCYFDFLEIRTTSTVSGPLYCATDIAAGQVFTASVNPLILFFYTTSNYYPGWSATVSFVPITGCT